MSLYCNGGTDPGLTAYPGLAQWEHLLTLALTSASAASIFHCNTGISIAKC
jgi:hypothetical protein